MHKISILKNGLTLITVDLPYLDSVTTMIAVGAGSRYESEKTNGISHFLEHMFFKGSRKYPTAEMIATLVDGIGAVNNAGTDKEVTFYWIKSAAKHIELASDILSSMVKESLLSEEEIEREKGVIIEEIRMYKDDPKRYVWDLYEKLQFGNQPLGWTIAGDEENIRGMNREDFVQYMASLYSPKNMALVYVGRLPKEIKGLADRYFIDLPEQSQHLHLPYKQPMRDKPQVNLYFKRTDQANVVLGVEAYHRNDPKRYSARVLALILGVGMSSRLFRQVRERRGLAYFVGSVSNPYRDSGFFASYSGLKLEKLEEGLEIIKTEMVRTAMEKVSEEELKKAKEMERGRLALHSEYTNFLAEYFGLNFVLDRTIETFEEYLKKIDTVTAGDIQEVAKELFKPEKFNLQIIGPFKNPEPFKKILAS